jgi:hypothetical protein
MLKSLTKKAIYAVAAFAFAVALTAMSGPAKANESPFGAMNGAWSGGGTITLASGAKEQIRCRATNAVDGSGANLQLTLRCASDSYKFELQSNVNHNAGAVSGTWAETTHRVGGTITGSASANRIAVRVEGTIAAMLTVSTKADKQQISIEAPGSEMSAVAISMNRGK